MNTIKGGKILDGQLKKLQLRGLKITPQRKLILDILDKSPHLTSEQITSKARNQQPNISAGTVYRNLNTLCELGLVRTVASTDGMRHFESTSFHHHYLYCLGCKDTVEINFCPMNAQLQMFAQDNGFEIIDHDFQIKGYCAKCRKGA